MRNRLLFILDPEPNFYSKDPLDLLDDPRYAHTKIVWNDVRLDDLIRPDIDLIVAVARLRPTESIELFRRLALASPPHRMKASFAILPRDVSAAVLQSTAEMMDDFVLWPASREELGERIRRLTGGTNARNAAAGSLSREFGFAQLVGEDPAFLRALEKLPKMAESGLSVLIAGETGTGKELCARAIHHFGKKPNAPFVPVDCGAIPDHVFENEMFGHVRGGYTDAHTDQKGFAEIADGGTLFLDEVDSLSLAAQSKLLRFLEEGTFKPLGASKFTKVVVRIIAASNQDLETCVQEKRFRRDLFYRLDVLRLYLPPLRERPIDIPILAKHFLQATGSGPNGTRRSFVLAAIRKLESHNWPGNVRELANVVQQAAIIAGGLQIMPEHVKVRVSNSPADSAANYREARAHALEAFERDYVEKLLHGSGGNVTQAAKNAHRNRRSIGRLIRKYGIDRTAC